MQREQKINSSIVASQHRANSLNSLKINGDLANGDHTQTLAQKNTASTQEQTYSYSTKKALRILLPHYFNIPAFNDPILDIKNQSFQQEEIQGFSSKEVKLQKGIKKRLKDLSILAEGMKRAKNIREQSRYYFIQGVILHNSAMWSKSIEMFHKFLKIVLFIKDNKSVELALNSIAIGYMYMNMAKEALEYHKRQISLSQQSEQFIGCVNIALCQQMLSFKQSAHQIYQQLSSLAIMSYDPAIEAKRRKLIKQLLARTHDKSAKHTLKAENSVTSDSKQKIKGKISPNSNKKNKASDKQKIVSLLKEQKDSNTYQKYDKQNTNQQWPIRQGHSLYAKGINQSHLHTNSQEHLVLQHPYLNPIKQLHPLSHPHNKKSTAKSALRLNRAIINADNNLNLYLQNVKHSFFAANLT